MHVELLIGKPGKSIAASAEPWLGYSLDHVQGVRGVH
jgi:hypothetical protein